jgi:hypothetical protein
MAAENGAFWGCFRRPFHRTPTRGPRRFRLLRQGLQSVTKSLKNVARAFWVPVFLTKIVCDLWIRGLIQYIPHHAYSRARRLHSYIERPWC